MGDSSLVNISSVHVTFMLCTYSVLHIPVHAATFDKFARLSTHLPFDHQFYGILRIADWFSQKIGN